MKMKPEHFEALKVALRAAPVPPPVITATDISMRQRWDWLHTANMPREWWHEVYAYANDTHIDTALRKAASDDAREWLFVESAIAEPAR